MFFEIISNVLQDYLFIYLYQSIYGQYSFYHLLTLQNILIKILTGLSHLSLLKRLSLISVKIFPQQDLNLNKVDFTDSLK